MARWHLEARHSGTIIQAPQQSYATQVNSIFGYEISFVLPSGERHRSVINVTSTVPDSDRPALVAHKELLMEVYRAFGRRGVVVDYCHYLSPQAIALSAFGGLPSAEVSVLGELSAV